MSEKDDILTNRILLKNAKFLDKVRLLLPSENNQESTTEAKESANNEQWSDRGDELLGIGAKPKSSTEDGLTERQLLSANEKLRRQLLSRNVRNSGSGHSQSKPKPKYISAKRNSHFDDEDDGESRTKSSSRMNTINEPHEHHSANSLTQSTMQDQSTQQPVGRNKRPSSYLDQVLASRQKRKRQNRKKEDD